MGDFKTKRGYKENQFYPGVIGIVNFVKNYVERFKHFLEYIGANQGDRYYIKEYSSWITSKWDEFHKLNELPEYYPITVEKQEQFDDFLSRNSSEQLTLF